MSATTRDQLHKQIDQLPDRIIEQIQSVSTEQNNFPEYVNWENKDWQEFSLQQFFHDEDEVEYTLEDAQEVYRQ